MNRIEATAYYDVAYGPGAHVVLLVLADDDLTGPAVRAFSRISEMTESVSFWLIEIVSPRDAEAVQALRYPQYRFVQDGSEQHQHVGILEDEELLDAFDHLEC